VRQERKRQTYWRGVSATTELAKSFGDKVLARAIKQGQLARKTQRGWPKMALTSPTYLGRIEDRLLMARAESPRRSEIGELSMITSEAQDGVMGGSRVGGRSGREARRACTRRRRVSGPHSLPARAQSQATRQSKGQLTETRPHPQAWVDPGELGHERRDRKPFRVEGGWRVRRRGWAEREQSKSSLHTR
jgi:hypothetical protein